MIIVGYQGIGKSTLAGKNDIIDLESSNFWHNNRRPQTWYIYYCNVAEQLSKQGYIVFVSSHKQVVEHLKEFCTETVYCVFPAIKLKEVWIDRLKTRYGNTNYMKDYKAWRNAVDKYDENIEELQKCGLRHYIITDMEYRLQDIVDYLCEFEKEWDKK